ncbi:hypothetical protein A4H97_17625 [Niastella yeongjuensis]|uniref:Nephrocystin 3-like N-terminal domain-containing protein n=1 Tax=Niastella yeongjuensis TaxID=354355 RepID=A0A1V9E1N2_9BACT|nr:ATP-binding protein [Niastella yeongjuensis]OQP40037.1 hypothetical protein A4H97_17625 [Niastella yeongjuensis]SEO14379.1 hypothetical protein SAMN05660816_02270 [Niastella yeongjuensis]
MPENITDKILANFQKKMEQSESTDQEELARWAFRQAAAVLHFFNPETLQPAFTAATEKSPRILLYEDMLYAPGRAYENLFILKPEIRKLALRRYSNREEMLAVIEKNREQPQTQTMKMWQRYLKSGELPDPNQLSYNELTDYCQIVSWMENIDLTLPPLDEIKAMLRKKSVVTNFEHLIIENFIGRNTELDFLQRHIYNGKSTGTLQKIKEWFNPGTPLPVLSVHGPGGIGKSALIGKLLWDNMQDEGRRIPFAYLPFDQAMLRIDDLFTLLVEAASQISQQYPEQADIVLEFNDRVREFRDRRGRIVSKEFSQAARSGRIHEFFSSDYDLFENFAYFINRLVVSISGNTPKKALLFFDTFEEVSYRDQERLSSFWRMLYQLTQSSPVLRIIIAGRNSIADLGIDPQILTELKLAELDSENQVLLLVRLGVEQEVAKAIAKQIGGNPLSLRLAASLVRSDKSAANSSDGIKGLVTRKWLLFQVDEQLVIGQLYARVLSHIHDERVRKIAHPGMVLRTVTPEIILNVLSPVCEIFVNGPADAHELFLTLKREQSLVQTGEKENLVYRTEIRQPMLRLLIRDKLSEVKMLHRKAVEYYSQQETPDARAEEMYHRLALGEDNVQTLEERWIKGIESSIAANLIEYSLTMKSWLAPRIGIQLSEKESRQVDTLDWERYIIRKVKIAITETDFMRALELLGEREERCPNSPLFALETKVYISVDDLNSALQCIERGIVLLSESGNRGRLAELFWLQSQVRLLMENIPEADQSLTEAGKAVVNAEDPVAYIHILCHRLLLRRFYSVPLPEPAAAIRVTLNEAAQRINESHIVDLGFVLVLVIDLLGEEFPKTVNSLSNYKTSPYSITPAILTSEDLQGLSQYREGWEESGDDFVTLNSLV